MNGQDNCQELRDQIVFLEELRNELRNEPNTNLRIIQLINLQISMLQVRLNECLTRNQVPPPQVVLEPPVPPPDHRFGITPPQAVSFDSNAFSPEIVLMVRTESGLATSFWNDQTNYSTGGGWGFWVDHEFAQSSRLEENEMPLVSWIDPPTGRFRVNGFFTFNDPNNNLVFATPFWELPMGVGAGFGLDFKVPPDVPGVGAFFIPFTAVSWYEGKQEGRLNVFGLVSFGPPTARKLSLREFWWDGQNWNWTDHPSPDEDIITMRLGQGGFTFPENKGYKQAFLFVITNAGGTPADTAVQLYHWTFENNWQWHNLGRPEDDVITMRSPVAVSYINSATGRTEVSVFITGQNRRTEIWQLYERHWNGEDIDDWEDWRSWGRPPFVPTDRAEGFNEFAMTCGVVWYYGTTLRINLFGYTEFFPDPSGSTTENGEELWQGGQLIEFWWNGTTWQWGSQAVEEAYTPDRIIDDSGRLNAVPLSVSSAVVTTKDSRIHLSVFGLDVWGRIWERFWDSHTNTAWTWFRH